MSYIFRFLATFVKKVVSCSNLMFSVSKKVQPTTTVSKNGLGLVFPSEKPLRIEILSIFVVVSLESQATDAKQQTVSKHINATKFKKNHL